jgi:Baseplate J-like protein
MKVQILQLDPHDDLASARDKLAWAQAQRVVLVWPDRARVLRKRLDLVLLRRQAARQGVEIGLVTRDPVVLEHAAALGIPCFRSSTRLPEQVWQTGRDFSLSLPARPEPRVAPMRPERSASRPLPRWLRSLALVVLGLTLLATAAALLPSATITLYPETHSLSLQMNLTLDPQAKSPDADGRVPARQVVLQPHGSIRVTTTGEMLVPGSPASGEVTLTNLTSEPVFIPAGTGVLPAGRPELRFTTAADVSLPAGQGATVGVRVLAANPGPAGNLPPDSLNAIDGPLGLRASVTQSDPMTGGTETGRASVAPADHATALRILTEQLLSQAASEIESQLAAGEALAPASLRVANTPQREFDRQVGEAADSVGLSLTLEVTALVYREQDVGLAVGRVLGEQIPAGGQVVPDTLTWTIDTSGQPSPELLPARARQEWYEPIRSSTVRRSARGLRPSEALGNLAVIPGQMQQARVLLAPSWWPIVPWLDVRIHVQTPWEGR